MARATSYRYSRYVVTLICPKCHNRGYCQEGYIMGTLVHKTDHRVWNPETKRLEYVKVCYW